MKTVVIIQARLSSERLPGKVLKLIGDRAAIAHTYSRASATGCRTVLAIPESQVTTFRSGIFYPPTSGIEEGIIFYGGPEHDVLGRYAQVAMQEQADFVVRITGDCPFVDPEMVWMAARMTAKTGHYVANCWSERTEPKGLDVEAFPTEMLIYASLHATAPADREHVTPYLQREQRFPKTQLSPVTNRPELRWVLDTQEDYDWFCKLATMIDCTPPHPTTRELLAFVKEHPEMERKE